MTKILLVLTVLAAVALQLDANPTSRNREAMFGEYFQGDIRLTEEQQKLISGQIKVPRTGWTYTPYHWLKNAQGIVEVPYRINPSEGFCRSPC